MRAMAVHLGPPFILTDGHIEGQGAIFSEEHDNTVRHSTQLALAPCYHLCMLFPFQTETIYQPEQFSIPNGNSGREVSWNIHTDQIHIILEPRY